METFGFGGAQLLVLGNLAVVIFSFGALSCSYNWFYGIDLWGI